MTKNQKIGEASKRWYYRLMWVSALLFAIGSFFIDTSGAGTVGNAASWAFGGTIFSSIVFSPLLFFSVDLLDNPDENYGYLKLFFVFIFSIVVGIIIFDILLFYGGYTIQPALWLVITGDFGPTYWGCEGDWVVIEEGSYCDETE